MKIPSFALKKKKVSKNESVSWSEIQTIYLIYTFIHKEENSNFAQNKS